MTEAVLLEERKQGLLVLTLNRPERRNALDLTLSDRLLGTLERAAGDAWVRAVLLRGAGSTFCVGGDVKAMAEGTRWATDDAARIAALRRRTEISRLLHEMPKPTLALIRGAAAGAGLSIALACDLRLAAREAKLTTAFAKVGLPGDFGGTYLLTQMLGSARARDLYLNSPVLSGTEALAQGLVQRVAGDDEAEAAGLEWAMALAAGPTVAFGRMKAAINLSEGAGMAEVLDLEAESHVRCTATEDHREAAAAFVAKRPPVFHGR